MFGENLHFVSVIASQTPIKKEASPLSTTLYEVEKDSVLEIYQYKDKYYRLQHNDETLWVQASSVTPYAGPIPIPPEKINKGIEKIESESTIDTKNNGNASASQNKILSIDEINSSPSINALESTTNNVVPTYEIYDDNQDIQSVNDLHYDFNPDLFLVPEKTTYMFPPKKNTVDIEIDGFAEIKYSGRDYSPKSTNDERWEAIRRDPIYNKLPRDVLVGDPKIDPRLKFEIKGELDNGLKLYYDIEQEPDFPGKYDIKIEWEKSDLTIFHFNTEWNTGSFINTTKALNGIRFRHEDEKWKAKFATGKLRSDPKEYLSQGNGGNLYKLGNKFVLEDSVHVFVNNVKQSSDSFTINYFEGSVKFKENKTINDQIKIIYEYTNPIEDFIPILSRKSFTGLEVEYQEQTKSKYVKQTLSRTEKIAPFNRLVKDLSSPDTSTKNMTTENISSSKNIQPVVKKTTPFGMIQLNNKNILLGSVTILLNGTQLPRNKYYLKTAKGKVHFRDVPFRETDELTISYQYYKTTLFSESLIGTDSTGPYLLKNKFIVNGSESINVGGEKLEPGRDYNLDHNEGKITFKFPIQYPSLILASYEAIKSTLTAPKSTESPLHVSMTYLQETANPLGEELILISPSENYTVTNNGKIYLAHFPLLPSENMSLIIDGESVSTDNLTIINPYTGELALTNPTGDEQSVQIKYSYNRSFKNSYIFQGKDGVGTSEANPYIDGEQFILSSTPVQNNGVLYIDLFTGGQTIRLDKDEEFSVNYGTNGQAIELYFLTVADNTASQLTTYPDSRDRITIVYNYTPEFSPDQGSVNQTTVGLSASAKLIEGVTVFGELTAASNNFSRPRLDSEFETQGTGTDNTPYFLGKANLVEDSETVYLNGIVQTKDSNYFMNYVLGTVTFRNQTPQPEDVILVNYEYYDNSGNAVLSNQDNFIPAIKIGGNYVTKNLTLAANISSIDKGFNPLSPINESSGSFQFSTDGTWSPTDEGTISAKYRREEINKGSSGVNDIFQNRDELSASSKYDFYEGWLKTNQDFSFIKNEQPPVGGTTTANNQYSIDDKTMSYKAGLEVGDHNYSSKISLGLSNSETDYVEKINSVITDTSSLKWDGNLNLDEVGFLGDFKFIPSYSLENENRQNKKNDTTGHKIQNQFGLDSRWKPFKNFNGSFAYSKLSINTLSEGQGTANINEVYNYLSSMSYTPFQWIRLSYSNTQKEAVSPLLNQKGKTDRSNKYSIGSFSPYLFATYMGMPQDTLFLSNFRNVTMKYFQTDGETLDSNDERQTTNERTNFSLNNVEPFPGIKFKPFLYQRSTSQMDSTVVTSTTSSNASSRFFESYSSGVSIIPKVQFLDMFTYELSESRRYEENIASSVAKTGTQNLTVRETPFYNKNQKFSFNPGNITVPIFDLFNLNLGTYKFMLSEAIEEKINSSNVQSGNSNTISIDNSWKTGRTASIQFKPFGLLNFNANVTSDNVHHSRNISSVSPETTFRDDINFSISTGYSPFKMLRTSASYSDTSMSQYISPELDIAYGDIVTARNESNGDVFKSYLERTSNKYSVSATFTPLSFASITGTGVYSIIDQVSIPTINVENTSHFTQKSGTLGLSLKPIEGLTLSSDYALTLTNSQEGYSLNTKLNYSYKPDVNYEIVASYTRVDNWGENLNRLQQSTSIQGEGDDIELSVVKVDNSIQTGSLKININIPLPEIPHAENFVITGEGYIKKITDKQDAVNTIKNSYDITGLIIKGRVNF